MLDQNEARYIEQIFDFGKRTVEDLMTPRSNVVFLPIDMPITEMVAVLKRTRHTKVPVYLERRDAIQGMLHARDLLATDLDTLENRPQDLADMLREPYFVPETKSASELFHTFGKRRLSVALAVDEYGGVTGLISMEDLLECIFGDIPSPSDVVSDTDTDTDAAESRDGVKRVAGSLSISQFNAEFGAAFDEGEFATLGGLLLHKLGELPEEGTVIRLAEFSFTVEEVGANRLKTLTVRTYSDQSKEPSDDSEAPATEESATEASATEASATEENE